MLECLADLDASLRERGGGARDPPRRARARAAEAGARDRRDRRLLRPRRLAVRARARQARAAALEEHDIELHGRTRAEHRRRHDRDPHADRASRTRCSRRSTATGTVPRREVAASAAQGAACRPSADRPGQSRHWTICGLEQEVERPDARRRDRGPPAARQLPAQRRSTPTPRTTTRSARTRPRGCRRTCTSAACRRSRSRARRRAGQGPDAFRRQLVLARLLPPRAAALPGQRARGVPAALPRARSTGTTITTTSAPGARARRASRSSTPACASYAARAGCTTARGSSSARS